MNLIVKPNVIKNLTGIILVTMVNLIVARGAMILVTAAAGAFFPSFSHAGPEEFEAPEEPVAQDTQDGVYTSRCVQILVKNGYEVQIGNRLLLCSKIENDYALKALQLVTEAKLHLDDLNFGGIVRVRDEISVDCITSLVKNGYDLASGNRIYFCRRVGSESALKAIQLVTSSRSYIDDTLLAYLSRIKTDLGKDCVKTLVYSGYSIDVGSRARMCSSMSYNWQGVAALEAATKGREHLDDITIHNLLSIKSEPGLACVKILQKNGYTLNSGSRTYICNQFRSVNGLEALAAIANSKSHIDDTAMSRLARIK